MDYQSRYIKFRQETMITKNVNKTFQIFFFLSILFRIIIIISNYGYESIQYRSDNSFLIIEGDQEAFIREAEVLSTYISTADWSINPINHIFNMQASIGTLFIGWPLILAILNASKDIYSFLFFKTLLIFPFAIYLKKKSNLNNFTWLFVCLNIPIIYSSLTMTRDDIIYYFFCILIFGKNNKLIDFLCLLSLFIIRPHMLILGILIYSLRVNNLSPIFNKLESSIKNNFLNFISIITIFLYAYVTKIWSLSTYSFLMSKQIIASIFMPVPNLSRMNEYLTENMELLIPWYLMIFIFKILFLIMIIYILIFSGLIFKKEIRFNLIIFLFSLILYIGPYLVGTITKDFTINLISPRQTNIILPIFIYYLATIKPNLFLKKIKLYI